MKFPEDLPNITTIVDTLSDYFDKDRIEEEAKDTKFIQTPRQLTGMAFFSICIMQGFGSSLDLMCGALSSFSINMCGQSLNERFSTTGVAFMKRMFEQMLQMELSQTVSMDFLSKFSGVFIQDSTVIKLPDAMACLFKGAGGNASQASAKVDLQLDVQGAACHMEIRSGTSSDNSQTVKSPKKGALYIRDLGYFNLTFFIAMSESGAYFLSRLKAKTGVYSDIDRKKAIDLGAIAKKMKADEIVQMPVFLGGRKYIPVFLILQKLPPQIISIKVERAKKDYARRGDKMTKESLEWCEFNSYFTNIPMGWFSALTIIQIYGIRWQIEIMFKVWKSIFRLGEVGKVKADRALCMLYGRLIWILLQMKIFRVYKMTIYGVSQKEVSELSGFKQMEEYKAEFRIAIKSGLAGVWHALIRFLFGLIQDFAIKKRRKKGAPPLYNHHFKMVMQ